MLLRYWKNAVYPHAIVLQRFSKLPFLFAHYAYIVLGTDGVKIGIWRFSAAASKVARMTDVIVSVSQHSHPRTAARTTASDDSIIGVADLSEQRQAFLHKAD